MKTIRTTIFALLAAFVTQFAVAQSHDVNVLTSAEPVKLVRVFPNPASDFLSIRFETPIAKSVKITLHNIIGNSLEVETELIDEYEIRLRVKDLPTGYYLVALKDDNNARNSIKFLKY